MEGLPGVPREVFLISVKLIESNFLVEKLAAVVSLW